METDKEKEIQELLEKLLASMGVEHSPVEITDSQIEGSIRFLIRTDDGRIIGKDGEHLRALNYIMLKITERRMRPQKEESKASLTDKKRFFIDVNDHQTKRIEEIRNHARMLGERAKLFNKDIEMPPMSSYERLIVHSYFAEDPEIETRSDGTGKNRKVVLRIKNTNL